MAIRRKTVTVRVGDLLIGSDHPIVVQSMTTTKTEDTADSVAQIIRLVEAGSQAVRLTAQGRTQAENLRLIKTELLEKGCTVPLIADIHFNPEAAYIAARYVEKVRINPGNFARAEELDERFVELLNICKEHNTALRIGVNHGSLSSRAMELWGDTPLGMANSALEFLEICRREDFWNVVVSFKSSNVLVMIEAYRLGARMMDQRGLNFPLHLGVTEAGEGEDGRIKSAVGIGALLVDGIGDTIRVSLTEEPENEIPVAFAILQAARARITKTEIISCPGCGRTLFDLPTTARRVKERLGNRPGLKIAVMGCIVNGPGEMADADFGYVGAGSGLVTLYRAGEVVERNIPQKEALEKLEQLIEMDYKL